MVINPGNPVGSVLSYDELRQLVVFCKQVCCRTYAAVCCVLAATSKLTYADVSGFVEYLLY